MAKKTQSDADAGIERARALYADGDYKGARTLARAVLAGSDASDSSRREAQAIVDSTRLARPSIIAGLVMLAVVAALFAWVLVQPHVH